MIFLSSPTKICSYRLSYLPGQNLHSNLARLERIGSTHNKRVDRSDSFYILIGIVRRHHVRALSARVQDAIGVTVKLIALVTGTF